MLKVMKYTSSAENKHEIANVFQDLARESCTRATHGRISKAGDRSHGNNTLQGALVPASLMCQQDSTVSASGDGR